MKKRMIILLAVCLSAIVSAPACDFRFYVEGNKQNCRAGDVVNVTVELSLTHRVCNVAAAQTKFKVDGVKVVEASPWKQLSPTRYQRTVKMVVEKDGKKKIVMEAIRTCEKEGGHGVFSLPKL